MTLNAQSDRLNFLLVTLGQLDALGTLRVAPDETHLIAPVSDWLAESAYVPDALSFGIYAGQQPVGLLSVVDPRVIDDDEDKSHFQPDCLYLWRIMIDCRQRAHGFGTAALRFTLDYSRAIGLHGVSLTTKDKEAGNALSFYESRGFKPTGRRLDDEIELIHRSG